MAMWNPSGVNALSESVSKLKEGQSHVRHRDNSADPNREILRGDAGETVQLHVEGVW